MPKYTDKLNLKKWNLDDADDLSSAFDIEGTLNENWDKVDEAIGTNIDNIATNTTNISTNTADITTLKENVETNTSSIATLETNVSTNTSNIETLQTSIETATEDIEALETAVEANTTSISNNTTSISELQESVSTNTSNIETNTTNIETLQTSVNTNTENISTLQTSVETNIEDIETLEEQVATNTTNIATNATSITAIEEKNTEQDETITSLNTSVSTNTSSIEELQEENERLRDDIKAISVTAEAEGETIYIDDSSNARLADIEIYGNTDDDGNNVEDSVDLVIQNKNLFGFTQNYEDEKVTLSATTGEITWHIDSLSSTWGNTARKYSDIFLRAGTYTAIFFASYESGTSRNKLWLDSYQDGEWTTTTVDFVVSNYVAVSPVTIENDVSGARVIYQGYTIGDSFNDTCKVMILAEDVSEEISEAIADGTLEYELSQKQTFSLPVQSAMTADDYFDFENMQEVHTDGDTLDMTDEQKEVAKEIVNTAHTYSTITNIYTTDDIGANIKVTYCKDLATVINDIQSTIASLSTTEEE